MEHMTDRVYIRNTRGLAGVLLAALLTTLAAVTAQAQTYPRVYVSEKNGNNSNNCDVPTAACQTLAGAYGKVASGGEIFILDSGSYGTLNIQKPLTITAAPAM
jgi:hypothetical protein